MRPCLLMPAVVPMHDSPSGFACQNGPCCRPTCLPVLPRARCSAPCLCLRTLIFCTYALLNSSMQQELGQESQNGQRPRSARGSKKAGAAAASWGAGGPQAACSPSRTARSSHWPTMKAQGRRGGPRACQLWMPMLAGPPKDACWRPVPANGLPCRHRAPTGHPQAPPRR